MGFYRPPHLLSVSETFSAGYRVPRRAICTESRRTPLSGRSNIISLKKSRLSVGNREKQDGERQQGRKDDIIMKPSKYLFYCVVESVPFYCTVSLWVQRQVLWLPACPVTRRPHCSPISTLTLEKFKERVGKKMGRSKNGKVHPVNMLQFRKGEQIPLHTLCNHQNKVSPAGAVCVLLQRSHYTDAGAPHITNSGTKP